MSNSLIHPDQILQGLLNKNPRSDKVKKMKQLHELCKHEYGRSPAMRDLSVANMARSAENDGILKAKSLYNVQSADYCALIEAWAAYGGPVSMPVKVKKDKLRDKYEWVQKIEDPAARTLTLMALAERDKLKAALDTIKSVTTLQIDMRPVGATLEKGAQVAVIEAGARLTDSQRKALEAAISPEVMREMDWTMGEDGEVRKKNGVFVYDPGYGTAIQQMLGKSTARPLTQSDDVQQSTKRIKS